LWPTHHAKPDTAKRLHRSRGLLLLALLL